MSVRKCSESTRPARPAAETEEGSLEIRLVPPAERVALTELKSIVEAVQRALSGLVRNLSGNPEAEVRAEVTDAEMGSIRLTILPTSAELGFSSGRVSATLIRDIDDAVQGRFRPELTPGLLREYQLLVKAQQTSHVRVDLRHADRVVSIDDSFRARFRAATREKVASRVTITGRIEALNIHSRPHTIRLYPTFPGAEGIPCRFEPTMLPAITDAIKERSLVQLTGQATFAAVGVFPSGLALACPPEVVHFSPERLRARIRASRVVPPGESATELLDRNRRAAGLADED